MLINLTDKKPDVLSLEKKLNFFIKFLKIHLSR